jgi:hypothetical protein
MRDSAFHAADIDGAYPEDVEQARQARLGVSDSDTILFLSGALVVGRSRAKFDRAKVFRPSSVSPVRLS